MTHWNHRVIKKDYCEGDSVYTEFSVREVYYNEDQSIYAWMEEPCRVHGESLESLKQFLERCLKALDQSILVDGEVVFNDGGDSEDTEFGPFDSVEELMKALEEEDEDDWDDEDKL